jgi:glycosyltransferase involved in cell wall biosynthesis
MKEICIIQLITALSDGGAETLVKDYALLLNNRVIDNVKYKVIIVTIHTDTHSANYKRVTDAGIDVISVYRTHNKFISLHRELFGKYYIPKRLKNIFKLLHPQSIHVHLALLKYIEPIAEYITDSKLLYTCHNEAEIMLAGKRECEGQAARKLIKTNGLKPIALHEAMAREMNELLQTDKTVVINNGINLNNFGNNVPQSKSEIRMSIGIPEDAFVIGHVGRFSDQKNHKYLVEIFRELAARRDDAFLLMVGDGKNMEDIKRRIFEYKLTSRTLILSHRSDTPQLYKAMDVFVFPSLFEGLPVTMVEAQASGLRCVVSDKINTQSILSEKTIPVELSSAPSKWCDEILSDSINLNHGELSEFDITYIINQLATMYCKDENN